MNPKIFTSAAVFFFAPLAYAKQDLPINTTKELKVWCKNETRQRFLAQSQKPYNWTASWWREINILIVEGSWRVNGNTITVKCSVKKGNSRKDAVLEFQE